MIVEQQGPSGAAPYFGYDVAHSWDRAAGLSIRRLVRHSGVCPIPPVLPGYRVALSLADNQADLAIGRRIATSGHFAAGSTVLGQPGDVFDGEMRAQADVLLFLFDPSQVSSWFADRGFSADGLILQDRPAHPDPGLLLAGQRLVAALSDGLNGDELYCEILIEALITRILNRHATAVAQPMPYREGLTAAKLKRVIAFIDTHLDRSLRLDEIARMAGSSRAHLARAFHNSAGLSLHQFVLQRRLDRARHLVLNSAMPTHAIANQVGFADAAHLSRAFSRAFHQTPTAIRQRSVLRAG